MSAVATVSPVAPDVAERIGTRLAEFKLPTLHAELVMRFKQAGQLTGSPRICRCAFRRPLRLLDRSVNRRAVPSRPTSVEC
jgi:hypothetical protein